MLKQEDSDCKGCCRAVGALLENSIVTPCYLISVVDGQHCPCKICIIKVICNQSCDDFIAFEVYRDYHLQQKSKLRQIVYK
jgi:hypothetical protein